MQLGRAAKEDDHQDTVQRRSQDDRAAGARDPEGSQGAAERGERERAQPQVAQQDKGARQAAEPAGG